MRWTAAMLLVCGCFSDEGAVAPEHSSTTSSGGSSSSSASSNSSDPGGSTGEEPSPTSTDASDGGSSSSSSSSSYGEASSSDTGEPQPYGDCFDGAHTQRNQLCDGSCVVNDRETWSACAPPCVEDICPGDGVCLSTLLPRKVVAHVCLLQCTTDGECPAGMTCIETSGYPDISACMWP